jgi:hypothetical protein
VRTLGELGLDMTELVDKAAGTAVGGKEDPKAARNRKALLDVLKSKVAVWV